MEIGVVGLGYWGPNLIRNMVGIRRIENIIACDSDKDRLINIHGKYPSIQTTLNYEDLLKSDCAAICIATPVKSHYSLAKQALLAGKHIWVEKPFTHQSAEARELIKLAEEKKVKIFVDHTFIYTGAIKKIKELIDKDELGDIIYFDSVRINLGLFQHDVNVIWDLAPHDFSIMKYLLPNKTVCSITACGVSTFYDQENIAQLSINFKNDICFAHLHVNWTSPVKIRRIIIVGKKKMLVYDDLENSEKIKVYDCGVEVNSKESIHKLLVQYRTGDMYSPRVEQTEALTVALNEFLNSIIDDRSPSTSGQDGLEVVRMLEASEKSIRNQGIPVNLDQVKSNFYSSQLKSLRNTFSSNSRSRKIKETI